MVTFCQPQTVYGDTMSKIFDNFGGQVHNSLQQVEGRAFEQRGASEHRSLQQRDASQHRSLQQRGASKYRSAQQRGASEYRNKVTSNREYYRPHSFQGYRQKQTFYNESLPFESSFALNFSPVTDKAMTSSKDSVYVDFYEQVNCPFCLEIQKDKIALVKHLDARCQKNTRQQQMLFSVFQILHNNAIKCNVCPSEVFYCVETYLQHLTWEDHVLNCSVEARNRKLTNLIYCSSCQVLVPNNLTQLYFHLQHKIHNIRRKSNYSSYYCTQRGIYCIYCLSSGQKVFKCLACPSTKSVFFSVSLVKTHFKTEDHLKNVKHCTNHSVYCSFCDEEFNTYETPFHMTSVQHIENEKLIPAEAYELCFYCGFSCTNLAELLPHMVFNCNEIMKIRQEHMVKTEGKDSPKTEQNRTNAAIGQCTSKELSLKTDRCILVKDDVDILKLVRTLKEIGPISSVDQYDSRNVVIEFEDKSSIETIYLIQNVLKINGKKVQVKFLGEWSRGKTTMTNTTSIEPANRKQLR